MIASFENNELPLIKKVAQTGKPIIVSTGMASKENIEDVLDTIAATGNNQVILLKCTSLYPTNASDSHLATIDDMRSRYQCLIGLSDHSTGISISLAGVALGACMIEKHFVLDRQAGGVDAAFSLQADELKALVIESQRVHAAIGQVRYGGSENEQQSKKYRRSIYCCKDIKQGELFSKENIRIIRPGFGLAPKYYHQIIGLPATQAISFGTALNWEYIEKPDNNTPSG